MANKFAPRQTIVVDTRISAIPQVPPVVPVVVAQTKAPQESGLGAGSSQSGFRHLISNPEPTPVVPTARAANRSPLEYGQGGGFVQQSQARLIDSIAAQILPGSVVCAPPRHPVEYGYGNGNAVSGFQQMTPIPSLVPPAPTPLVINQVQPPRLPEGSSLWMRSPFQSAMPVTPPANVVVPVDRVIDAKEVKYSPGSMISAHGLPDTVDTIPLPTRSVVARRNEPIPHSGDVIAQRGGADSFSAVAPVKPIFVVQNEWRPGRGDFLLGTHGPLLADPQTHPAIVQIEERLPHAGDVRSLIGGVDSVSVISRANPVIVSLQEPRRPFPGSVSWAIGGVSSGTVVTPAYPQIVAQASYIPDVGSVVIFTQPTHETHGPTAQVAMVRPQERIPHSGATISALGGTDSIAVGLLAPQPAIVRGEERIARADHAGSVWFSRGGWHLKQPPIIDDVFDVVYQVDDTFNIIVTINERG